MAIISLTYRDIPVDERLKAAQQAKARLRALLMSPGLTPEQRQELTQQLQRVDEWANGTLP